MSQSQASENKMGIMPIPRLLFSMSLPLMLSMLVQALYNIVDSIFVSMINENALTAVSLIFPVQNLMIAIAAGTAVGVNALLSRNLGEQDFEGANKAAINGLFLSLLSYIAVAVLGGSLSHFFLSVQTNDPQIVAYGTTYMRIITVCSFGCFLQIMLERLLQSTGRTIYTMITQATGAIINIIMDPILIFGIGFFPKMGVAGAAVATVFGQIVAMILALIMNLKANKDIQLHFRSFQPCASTIGHIYEVGVPSIVMQSIGSVMTFGFNKILLLFTPTATAVFGVYFKLNSFIFMPIFGLNNGMVPIIAYNYGARNRKRIMQTIKLSVVSAVSLMLVGLALFILIPDKLLGLFHASSEMLAIGVPALRIICLSFLFAGYCIIVGSVFQALGNGVYSLIVSLARQIFAILPSAYILAKVFGLHAVWWSFPIAELVSVAMTTIFFRRIYREKLKNL